MKLSGTELFGMQKDRRNLRSAAKEMANKLREREQSVQKISAVDSVRRGSDTMLSSISAKLMAGSELTDYELSYLRRKNPQIYRVAVQAARARTELRRKLKNAKSEEEVRAIRTGIACAAASGGLGASTPVSGGDQRWNPNNLIVNNALNNEYVKSTPSAAELRARKQKSLNRKV